MELLKFKHLGKKQVLIVGGVGVTVGLYMVYRRSSGNPDPTTTAPDQTGNVTDTPTTAGGLAGGLIGDGTLGAAVVLPSPTGQGAASYTQYGTAGVIGPAGETGPQGVTGAQGPAGPVSVLPSPPVTDRAPVAHTAAAQERHNAWQKHKAEVAAHQKAVAKQRREHPIKKVTGGGPPNRVVNHPKAKPKPKPKPVAKKKKVLGPAGTILTGRK